MTKTSIQSLKAELESVHKRNELAIQAANLGTWDWDIESGAVIFNDLWAKMLGYELNEVMSHVDGWSLLLHPDDAASTAAALQENVEGKTSFYLNEHRLKTKSGAWLWVQARGCVIQYSDDGRPLKHTGTMLDINDRKLRELNLLDSKDLLEQQVQLRTNELQESEEKLSSILRLAPEGILTTDCDGNIQIFNEGAQKLFGYSQKEAIGKQFNLLIRNTYAGKEDQPLKKLQGNTENTLHLAVHEGIHGFRKDGSCFAARLSLSWIKLKEGFIFAAIIRDITELLDTRDKMAEAKATAEVANRAKSDFLANMSHELRTPLNAIIGYAQLIEQEILGPLSVKGYKDYAEAIHFSGEHLLSLIQDILDISKIEAKKHTLKEEAIDVAVVADACHLMTKEAASDAGIRLSMTVDDQLPQLYADEKSLKQMLLNLLSNAIKFTPAGGKVDLKAYLDEEKRIVCEVRDTGIGLAQDDIPKILQPFIQIKNQVYPKGTQEGTGLGLTIVKSFADLYQAEMIINSKPDAGTCVRLVFPAERTLDN